MDRVSQGVPFKPSASTWNLLLEMVDKYKADRSSPSFANQPSITAVNSTTSILVRRAPDDDPLTQFSPVVLSWDEGAEGLGADVTATGPAAWMLRPIATAISPSVTAGDSDKMVGIAADTIMPGEIGRVYVSGLCLAKVNINSPSDPAAVLGGTEALESAETGPVQILQRASTGGTEPVLCVVLLNAGASSGTADATDHAVRATAAGSSVSCYLQTDTGSGLTDIGDPITVNVFPTPAREDFETNGIYPAFMIGDVWYAETGPLTECIEIPDFSAPGVLNCATSPPTIDWADRVQRRVLAKACPPPPPPP